jgi:hypothetical protein
MSNGDFLGKRYIVLNNRVIKKYEDIFVSIKKKFILPKSTVLIISEDLGGSGTIPEYHFLEIFPNGRASYSKGFYSDDYTFKAHRVGRDTIVVDLGYEKGRRKFIYYKNGKMTFSDKAVRLGITNDECKVLYRIYKDYVNQGKCVDDIFMVLPMIDVRGYNAISQKPELDGKKFESLLKRDCRRRRLESYKFFGQYICQ